MIPEASPLRTHARPGAAVLAGVRVLAADDEPAVLSTWARYFTRLGASVTTAADGAEALELIRAHDFDAVILDLKMPRVTGWDVLLAVRSERPDLAGRIVMISGDLSALSAVATAEHLQPWRLLEKPADLETIGAALMRAAGVADRA